MAKDNSAKTLSIDDVGKTANAYEEIPTMTNMEQVQIVAECAYRIGDHWANHPNSNLGTTERVMGAVHGVLDMFQNGSPDIVPPFILIPVDPETDTGAMTSLQRNGNWTEVDWNYNEPMYLEVDRHLKNEPAYSLTGKFEEQYEIHRERYRTAAIDLFKP